jgi:hypothetical protein
MGLLFFPFCFLHFLLLQIGKIAHGNGPYQTLKECKVVVVFCGEGERKKGHPQTSFYNFGTLFLILGFSLKINVPRNAIYASTFFVSYKTNVYF